MNLYEKMLNKTKSLKGVVKDKSDAMVKTVVKKTVEARTNMENGMDNIVADIGNSVNNAKEQIRDLKGEAILREYDSLVQKMSEQRKVNLLSSIGEDYLTLKEFSDYCFGACDIRLPVNIIKYFIVIGLSGKERHLKSIPLKLVTDTVLDMLSNSIHRDKNGLTLLLNSEECTEYCKVFLYLIIETVLTVSESKYELVEEDDGKIYVHLINLFNENLIEINGKKINKYLSDIAEINKEISEPAIFDFPKLLRYKKNYKDTLPVIDESMLALKNKKEIKGFDD